MARPPLTDQQAEAALHAYATAREQAVRYVLSALDPSAYDAPARPYREVLARVQELIATEIGYYAEPEAEENAPPAGEASETASPPPTEEEATHG
jgi:hypothetical protein